MSFSLDQFKQALRKLARAPLFSILSLLTIAIGIGANTVVFSVVDGVLLKILAYPHPEQLMGESYNESGKCAARRVTRLRTQPGLPGLSSETWRIM